MWAREETGGRDLALTFTLTTEAQAPPGTEADDLTRLAQFVLEAEYATGSWDVTVALVDDARLRALHRDFMGIDSPTDIMTFPQEESGANGSHGGDLVISVDHARTQAAAWGLTPAEEIRFLVMHGLLHMLGWRDDSEAQRNDMLERQEALFAQWRKKG